MTQRLQTFLKNVMFSIFTMSVFALMAEVMLHKFGFSFQPLTHPGTFGAHFEAADTADYIQDPTRFWIPKPDSVIRADWVGKQGAHINALGLRGPLPQIPKSPATVRILCLGDSGTFGWGMNDDQAYPHFLQTRLNQWANVHSDLRFEVVNAGVNGYSTFQAIQQYNILESKLNPDIVTIATGRNDFSPVPVTDASRPALKPWQITVMKWIARTKTGQMALFTSQREMITSLFRERGQPDEETIRVSDEEYKDLMTHLADHCKERERPLVYIHRAGRQHFVRALTEHTPICLVDFKRLESIGQVREFLEGGHPDAPVYDLIGEEVFIQMNVAGLLTRYIKKPGDILIKTN